MAKIIQPTVIVLASGKGERFKASGGKVYKLKALLGGKPVLEHTLDAVKASGLPWHLEDAGHPGMGDSIAAAVRATQHATGWLILPGDLPLIRGATLRELALELANHEVVVPMYRGQRGHPVGFSVACGPELMRLGGAEGAASVLRAHPVAQIAVEDEGTITDIDTVDALRAAEALWQVRQNGG
jgi:molybdenum cofactor cytidylyltransferase